MSRKTCKHGQNAHKKTRSGARPLYCGTAGSEPDSVGVDRSDHIRSWSHRNRLDFDLKVGVEVDILWLEIVLLLASSWLAKICEALFGQSYSAHVESVDEDKKPAASRGWVG